MGARQGTIRWWPKGRSTILSAMILRSRHARSLTVLYLCLPLAAHSAAQPQDPEVGAPAGQDPLDQGNADPDARIDVIDGKSTEDVES